MLFSEFYGTYFRTVASVLDRAVTGNLCGKDLPEIVRRTAFGESVLTIPAALTDGSWPLLTGEMTTTLRHSPSRPLTTLEKRWLKALLQDPRIALFELDLDEVDSCHRRHGDEGDFDELHRDFVTRSGRHVDVYLYVDKGQASCGTVAIESILKAMEWDEKRFNLEYDLNRFNVVAVDFFRAVRKVALVGRESV